MNRALAAHRRCSRWLKSVSNGRAELGATVSSVIMASFRGNSWVAQVYEKAVNENDIINYIKNIKLSGCKISNKVVVALAGIDENAKLIAKELKISIWDNSVTNRLLNSYGMKRMITL